MVSEPTKKAPWTLFVVVGEDAGRQYTLGDGEISIGRGAGQDIMLHDHASSRRHVAVTREGDRYRVTDLGSANGTLVNGHRITTHLLEEGDEIKVGNSLLRFARAAWWEESLPDAAPPPALAAMIADLSAGVAKPIAQGVPLPVPEEPTGLVSWPQPPAPAAPVLAKPAATAPDEDAAPKGSPATEGGEEEFREVPTALTRDAALAPLPPLPELDLPDESKLPAPIVARLEAQWRIQVGEVLTAYHPEIAELIEEVGGLSWTRGRLVLAHGRGRYVVFLDPQTMTVERHDLAPADHPLSVEAVLTGRDYRGRFLLSFGSGVRDGDRRVVRIRISGGDFTVSEMPATNLYQQLLNLPGFATSTLNVEGAALLRSPGGAPPRIRLFQRGNGKARGRGPATSATVEILQIVAFGYLERCGREPDAWLPQDDLLNVRRYDLGAMEGVALSFTDACGLPDGRVLYVAMAERCIDAGIPGPCFGTALGVLEPDGSARYAPILEPDGAVTTARISGVTVDEQGRVYAALRATAQQAPRLCRLELAGLALGPR